MRVQILEALRLECITNGIKSANMVLNKDGSDAWLLVKMLDHDFKICVADDSIQLMLKQCLHIDGLFQKSPYGKAYDSIKQYSLDDPSCFKYVIDDLGKRWFLE